MSAKKASKWRVVSEYNTLSLAEFASQQTHGIIEEIEIHVCSHCDAPWPNICSGLPGLYERIMLLSHYRRLAGDPTYTKLDYCCDETKADCEKEND